MRIIHVAAELAPWAKVGGLADVVQGLANECARQGHTVEVILPAYPWLSPPPSSLPFRLTLLDLPDFQNPQIYGYKDDVERFARFSVAAAKYIATRSYDILHLHDWHTALLATLLPRTLLTLHNLSYMGLCTPSLFEELGIPCEESFRGEEGYSLLRVGILKANQLTTVSPSYAQQILFPEFGYTLSPLLQQVRHKLHGILNGIDTSYWNPETDPILPLPYHTPEGKRKTQSLLLKELGLNHREGPLTAAITRLVWQKGPDMIFALLEKTVEKGGTFIFLGSTSEPNLAARCEALAHKLPKDRFFTTLTFDEQLSHKVYALADLLVVPSLFEPCGLTQLIAMRYGALPLVRHTGGLADTVSSQNGFSFDAPEIPAALTALDTAWATWAHPEQWHLLQEQAFTTNWSWEKPAHTYLSLYKKVGGE